MPPKVRVFWWRVVNGFLPAKAVLHKRHIEPVPNCDLCGAAEESIAHILMECTAARCFRARTRTLTGAKVPRLHSHTWARDLTDPRCCSEKDAAIFLCGMWSLWMARNKRRHGEASIPMKKAVEWTIDTAFDLWQIAHPIKQKGLPRAVQTWRPPPPGWTKCNSDAAFVEEEGRGATGVVLRDQDGRACGGRARWYDHCLHALSVVAMACYDGLQFAIDRVQRLQLETDCQVLVNLWEKRQHKISGVDPLLQQIEVLSRSLADFSFSYSSRTCNLLAHECAKLVSRNNQVEEWLVPPPGLWGIIESDCNHARDQ